MLKFKIEHSTDTDLIGVYELDKKVIKFGTSLKGDIIIDDDKVEDIHMVIYQTAEKLIIDMKARREPTYINGKKLQGLFTLKNSDIITLGNTKIEIVDFSPPKESATQTILRNQFEAIAKNEPKLANLLLKIESRMKSLTDEEKSSC